MSFYQTGRASAPSYQQLLRLYASIYLIINCIYSHNQKRNTPKYLLKILQYSATKTCTDTSLNREEHPSLNSRRIIVILNKMIIAYIKWTAEEEMYCNLRIMATILQRTAYQKQTSRLQPECFLIPCHILTAYAAYNSCNYNNHSKITTRMR